MSSRIYFLLLLLGLILLLTSSFVACGQPSAPTGPVEPRSITHLSTEQDRVSFVARAEAAPVSDALAIYSSATGEPLMWEAKDDALWLTVVPTRGTFDCGVSEVTMWVYPSDMSVGHHSATISIFVPEADNSPLNIFVDLNITPPEDPAVVAAREFWESDYYRRYWDLNAASDVKDVVKSYEFPTPDGEYYGYRWGFSKWHQHVAMKGHEFEYNPETYTRPIAKVHCLIKFSRKYKDERGTWLEEWEADTIVVLEVEPEPYHVEHNEWKIVDYYAYTSGQSNEE